MKNRSWFKMLCMALVLTLVLTACSSGNNGNNANNEGANEPAPSNEGNTGNEPETKEPLDLSIMSVSWASSPNKDDLIEQELEQNSNTNLDVTWVPVSEYMARMNVLLASGNIPDIMAAENRGGVGVYSPQVRAAFDNGVFHDLTEFVEAPDFAEKYPNLAYEDQIWENAKYNGKTFSIPRYVGVTNSGSGIMIRKDLLDEAGLEVPTTVEDIKNVAIALSDPPQRYGIDMGKDLRNLRFFAIAFTGVHDWKVDEEGNFTYQKFMPEYKDFLTWTKELYDAKAIDPEFPLGQGTSSFGDGKSVMFFHTWSNWLQNEENAFFAPEVTGDPIVEAILPIEGPKAWTTEKGQGLGRPAIISSEVPKEDIPRILEFFNYTASKEFQELYRYGIEDVHHNVVDGKKVLVTDKYEADAVGAWEEVMRMSVADPIEAAVAKGASDFMVQRMQEISDFADRKIAEAGIERPTLTLTSESYNENWGSLTKDLSDNEVKVVMGEMSLEEWDAYVESITSSEVFKTILEEYKAAHLAQ